MSESERLGRPAPPPRQDPGAWMASLLALGDDALVGLTPEGIVTDWSAGATRLFGWTARQMIGHPVWRLVPLDQVDDVDRLLSWLRSGRRVTSYESVGLHADGTRIDILFSAFPISGGDAAITGLSMRARDVTLLLEAVNAQRRATEAFEAQQQVLQQIARGDDLARTLELLCHEVESRFPEARCSVLVRDREAGTLHHAAAPSLRPEFVAAIDGLPVAVGMGACGTAAALADQVIVPDATHDELTAPFLELLSDHGLRSTWSYPLVDRHGEVLGTFALYRSHPHVPDNRERRVVTAAGHLAALAIERQRDHAAVTAASLVDPLTGLPNRAQFLDLLAHALEEATSSGTTLAVLFLDLDRFKGVNDSMGHPAGDELLIDAARRLRTMLRSEDVLSRFGGDEFTVLVRNTALHGLASVADRVLGAFADPFLVEGREFYMSVSIGVALSSPGVSPIELIRDADAAMYAAKAQGAGHCVVFGEELRDRALDRVNLETDLRHALEHDQLVVHYQPIFDLGRRACIGAEALVRWQHPTRGLLLPDHFIPLAEETALVRRIDAAVLDTALTQIARWRTQGIDLPVSINVSALQLSDPGLVDSIEQALRRHDVPGHLLNLEITETAVMEQLDTARRSLQLLAETGVRAYIDDFGTGYSSIGRLSDLPVAGLKIDRRFTVALGVDPSMSKVTVAIIDLAHALDLEVVAEGIESQEAVDALIALDCPAGQGYHLGMPADAGAITELLLAQQRAPRP